MPWNPHQYNQFKAERYKPYLDLITHIKDRPHLNVLDLGCGTGELTKILAEKLTSPTVLGIDSSSEMLAQAPEQYNLQFRQISIEEQLQDDQNWDIIIANASLQWVEKHESLFTQLISKLNPNGQLAVQMPSQRENILNNLLLDLVQEEPYAAALNGWKRISPLLSIDGYTRLLFENGGKELTVYQKVYPVVAQSPDNLYEFIAGSSLIPYFEKLGVALQARLSEDFKHRIQLHFPKMPAIYAFKRLLIYSVF